MLTLQELKEELEAHEGLTELVDVLKQIAAMQMHQLEKGKNDQSSEVALVESFFELIDFSTVEHPLASQKRGTAAIIMVTSDEGFMGGLNTKVINMALSQPDADHARLIIIGERGADYLRGLGREFKGFPGVPMEHQYRAAEEVKDYIMLEAMSGRMSRLSLVYPKPESFTYQIVEVLPLLPCSEIVRVPAGLEPDQVIVESEVGGIIEYLVQYWLTERLILVYAYSKLAELASRTVHLEECYDSLEERGKGLQLQYFQSHHNFVDKGMREVFAARLMGKNN